MKKRGADLLAALLFCGKKYNRAVLRKRKKSENLLEKQANI